MMMQVKRTHWIYQHLLLLEDDNYYVSSETLATLEELKNSDEFTRFLNGKTDSTLIILVDEILPPEDPFYEEIVTEHLLPLMSPSLWAEFLSHFTDTAITPAITRETAPVMRQEIIHLRPNTPLSPLPPPSSDKRVSLTGARRRYHGYYDDSDGFGEVRPGQRYYGNNYRRRPLMAPELSSRAESPLVKPTDEASFKAAIEEIVDTIPSVNYEKDIDGILRLYEGVKRLDRLFACSLPVNGALSDSLMVRLLEKMSLKRVDAFERYCKGTRTLPRLRQWLKRVTVSAQSYAYPGYCALAQRKSGIPSMAYWFPPMTLETGRTIHTKIGVRQK